MSGFNTFCDPACFNFIGGGGQNCILNDPAAATNFNAIVAGQANTISPGACYSNIFGGQSNTSSGSFSSILGGANNNDGGLNNVFIAGSGITGAYANMLHINGLWANGICNGAVSGPYAAGTIFWLPYGTTPTFPTFPTTGVLWIM